MATFSIDIETPDTAGCTPLMYAVTAKKVQRVQALLATSDVNAQDRDGKTALHHAALSGQPLMIAALLRRGAKIDMRDKDGATALIYAAMCGYEDVVRMLLAKKADIRSKDRHGRSAHEAATRSSYLRIATLLAK